MMFGFAALPRHALRLTARAAAAIGLACVLILPAVPAVSAATTCQATFGGDATGSRDVTSSLTSFLRNHGGRQLCLKPRGIYRVDGIVRISGVYGLHLDGRMATLKAVAWSPAGANRRQLYIESARYTIIKNLIIRGGNPNFRRWNPDRQHEPGIWIDGGSSIHLVNVYVRDTYGDGIYVGYRDGKLTPPSTLVFDHVNIAAAGRNGIAVVGGNYILIKGSVISDVSLIAVDLEPDRSDANIHHVRMESTVIRRYGQSGADTGYAFAANGKAGLVSYITVLNNRADRFLTTVRNQYGGTHRNITFKGNVSTYASHAYFANIVGLSYSGNTRITVHRSNVR